MSMFFDFFDVTNVLLKVLTATSEKATTDKKTYADKLETASGDDIFKYILLTNMSALDAYVAQTRIQAAQSFRLSQIVAMIGFVLLAAGIGLGMYMSLNGKSTMDAAYLSSVAGIVTEFISGVFFYLYNRTLQQINRFHDKMVAMQQLTMSYLGSSVVADSQKRDDARVSLSTALVASAARALEHETEKPQQ